MELYSEISKSSITWLPCAAHKIQIAINKAWVAGGAEPLLEKCQKISVLFKNKEYLANRLARVQRDAEEDELKPVTMGTTRWNSKYEMVKRIFKMKSHISRIVREILDDPNDLPAHIDIVKVQNCLLSKDESEVLQDIISLLEKASKFGNEIPTISVMYSKALKLLPDRSTMTTAIGTKVYEVLDNEIKVRWSYVPPQLPEPATKKKEAVPMQPMPIRLINPGNKRMPKDSTTPFL
ncbi:hypothetical protein BGZ76_007165 [Entomortierella beljakovae]|nr:hypothetical protein BGZ76_007165 [Entomortierella beljakovae]